MIRLTGGQFRGRALSIPEHSDLRPSLSKLRQALFNTLQTRVEGARVLELFAGSGALGFEALSRGATSAIFVDQSRHAERAILKNAASLEVSDAVQVICADVLEVGPRLEPLLRETPVDLVLADPPYQKGFELKLLEKVREWTQSGALFVLESSAHDGPWPESPEGWKQVRDREYGDTRLTHYERV